MTAAYAKEREEASELLNWFQSGWGRGLACQEETWGAIPWVRRPKGKASKSLHIVARALKDLKDQIKLVMKVACRLPYEQGLSRVEEENAWLDRQYPSAAASLLEGSEETLTISRLGLITAQRRRLGTTNVVERQSAWVGLRARHVTRWRDGKMERGSLRAKRKVIARRHGERVAVGTRAALNDERRASAGQSRPMDAAEADATKVTDSVRGVPTPLRAAVPLGRVEESPLSRIARTPPGLLGSGMASGSLGTAAPEAFSRDLPHSLLWGDSLPTTSGTCWAVW